MSIIHDALKKTQNNLLTPNSATPAKDKVQPSAAGKINISPVQKRTSFSFLTSIFLICLACVGTYMYYFDVFTPQISSWQKQNPPYLQTAGPSANGPKLNGIMTMNDTRVALINNEIYETGDSFQDMKILNIALDRVDLMKNGQIKTITVGKK